jgi:hypothetical protein
MIKSFLAGFGATVIAWIAWNMLRKYVIEGDDEQRIYYQ